MNVLCVQLQIESVIAQPGLRVHILMHSKSFVVIIVMCKVICVHGCACDFAMKSSGLCLE